LSGGQEWHVSAEGARRIGGDDLRGSSRRVGPLWFGFAAFATMLTLIVPDDLYSRSAFLREIADAVAALFGSIGEFAAHSQFPGTTRIVLALLWICVPVLTWIQWRFPGYVLRAGQVKPRSRVYLLAFLVAIFSVVPLVPMVWVITPDQLHGGTSLDFVVRLVTTNRMAFGLIAGLYCVISAWLLACVPAVVERLRNF
jgi:hypothetical protein